jgi:membrane-associated phospholipid phosphatase
VDLSNIADSQETDMSFFLQHGIDWIIAIQSLGGWLELPMKFFTLLGYENFFFLVLPLIYWSVDADLGMRVALVLAVSNNAKPIFKLLFAAPRPYWLSGQVKPFLYESSFGIPSGHAQDAVALWGIMAAGVKKRWAWVLAFVIAFFVGFSRLYLGVHFVHDVIAGWIIGFLILFAFVKFWDPVAIWLKTKTVAQQILVAFLISLMMIGMGMLSTARLHGYIFPMAWTENALRAGPIPDPVSMESILTAAGSLFGLAAGAAWIASRGGYQASGPLEKRAFRYAIGLIGIMVLWIGLGEIFPRGEALLPLILRYVRYSLVGLWVMAGAPWLFFHFKLADRPKM